MGIEAALGAEDVADFGGGDELDAIACVLAVGIEEVAGDADVGDGAVANLGARGGV